jgi:hypothetical protein
LPTDKLEDTPIFQVTEALPDDIQSEFKLHIAEDHLLHENCSSSEQLLMKICSLTDNSVLNKLWPHRRLNFYVDSDRLIGLGNKNYTMEDNAKCNLHLNNKA